MVFTSHLRDYVSDKKVWFRARLYAAFISDIPSRLPDYLIEKGCIAPPGNTWYLNDNVSLLCEYEIIIMLLPNKILKQFYILNRAKNKYVVLYSALFGALALGLYCCNKIKPG